MTKKVHLYIDGMVLSVGFRAFVKRHADSLKLKGYVRNIEGGVEVVAEGEDDAIENMIAFCKKGPSGANVTNVTVEEQSASLLYTDFSIRP